MMIEIVFLLCMNLMKKQSMVEGGWQRRSLSDKGLASRRLLQSLKGSGNWDPNSSHIDFHFSIISLLEGVFQFGKRMGLCENTERAKRTKWAKHRLKGCFSFFSFGFKLHSQEKCVFCTFLQIGNRTLTTRWCRHLAIRHPLDKV